MTTEDALQIKQWMDEGKTLRRIADLSFDKWPERGYIKGNQIEGREICLEACRVLKESIYNDPWN